MSEEESDRLYAAIEFRAVTAGLRRSQRQRVVLKKARRWRNTTQSVTNSSRHGMVLAVRTALCIEKPFKKQWTSQVRRYDPRNLTKES
jgi:hypothetical protein